MFFPPEVLSSTIGFVNSILSDNSVTISRQVFDNLKDICNGTNEQLQAEIMEHPKIKPFWDKRRNELVDGDEHNKRRKN